MNLETIDLSDILVAILGILATGLGFIIKEQRERIKKVQEQLSDKKYVLYHEIFSIFFDIIKMQKNLLTEKDAKIVLRLLEVKKDLIIYAPDNVLDKFFQWNLSLTNTDNSYKQFDNFLDLFILIRKDMGHRKTTVTKDDILRSIMTTDKDFLELKSKMKNGA
jgi:CRISPR/Cas system-associated endonuclease Cas3-HD